MFLNSVRETLKQQKFPWKTQIKLYIWKHYTVSSKLSPFMYFDITFNFRAIILFCVYFILLQKLKVHYKQNNPFPECWIISASLFHRQLKETSTHLRDTQIVDTGGPPWIFILSGDSVQCFSWCFSTQGDQQEAQPLPEPAKQATVQP